MTLPSSSSPLGPSPESPPERPEAWQRWLFLLSGGLLSLVLVVAIGRERGWGEPHFAVDLLAPRADGLQEGMEVRLSGLPIGRVESLDLQGDARVAVRLQINDRYRHLIGPRSRAQSGMVGLVGQTFVNLTPDPSPKGEGFKRPLPPLAYEPPPDLNQLLADLARSRAELDQTLALTTNLLRQQLPDSLGSLQRSTTKLSSSMGDLTAMAKTVSSETRRTVPSVRRLTGSLQRESGQIAPALRHTLTKADATLSRADQTAEAATQASREATALLRQARPSLIPTLEQVEEITAATQRLVRFFSRLGFLEPGRDAPRSTPLPPPGEGKDLDKAPPSSADPSPSLR